MSVSVGFSPVPAAAASTLTGEPATSATSGAAGEGSLFAQILALLGGNATPTAESDLTELTSLVGDVAGAVSGITTAQAAPTGPTLSVAESTDPAAGFPADLATVVDAAKQLDTTGGKSLLKSLADALTALNDSLEAGDTPDARQLESVDELASALAGLLAQAQPALASATPAAPAADGSTISGVDTESSADLAETLRDLISALAPAATQVDADADVSPDATQGADLPTQAPHTPTEGAEVTPPAAALASAESPAEASTDPVMAQLADILDQVADKLSEKAPVIAEKLTALGKSLENSSVTAGVLDALGLAEDAAAEVTDLAQRIAQPKPPGTPGATTEVAAFTPASLDLPEATLGTTKAAEGKSDATTPSATQAPSAEPDAAQRAGSVAPADIKAADAKPIDRTMDPAAKSDADPASSQEGGTADTPESSGLAAPAQSQSPNAASAVARTAQGAYQAQSLVPSLPQIAFEIARHVEAGAKRFQIRLDPPELGRIDVRLSVDNSGTVQARMTVERAETLDMMQRDQRALQQALQQAGLDMSKTSLEFSLSQNGFGRNGQSFSGWDDVPRTPVETGLAPSDTAPAPAQIYRGTATQRGLNLFV